MKKRLSIVIVSILYLSVYLWAYGDDAQPDPLTLDDLLGVWHCVLCADISSPGDTLREDSTAFLTVLPDSVLKLHCSGNLLDWFNFRSTSPDTMLIDAQGPLTNNVLATLEWSRVTGTSDWAVSVSVFDAEILSEVRRKISTEPQCPPIDATPTTWGNLKHQYTGDH